MSKKNNHHQTTPTPPPPAAATPAAAEPAAAEPSPTETEPTLQQQLEQAKAAAAENWEKFLRAAAELDNYRKRVAREREELIRSTAERVVAALLPVLDNLERAIASAKQHPTENAALLDGLSQIHTQFRRTLEEFGLEEVKAHTGHPFDPNLHEAIDHLESAEHPEGVVLNQIQRGYKLANRLLRPARVIVSKGKPASQTSTVSSTNLSE
jgi:molecular chaperone GrpE